MPLQVPKRRAGGTWWCRESYLPGRKTGFYRGSEPGGARLHTGDGRKTTEYGADYFGIDYDQNIYQWIESNYRVAGEFGRFRRDESGSVLAALLYEKERH